MKYSLKRETNKIISFRIINPENNNLSKFMIMTGLQDSGIYSDDHKIYLHLHKIYKGLTFYLYNFFFSILW